MTKEQYKHYQEITKEIEPIKSFLMWCGDRYKEKTICKPFFNIITKAKSFVMHKNITYGVLNKIHMKFHLNFKNES